MFQYRKINHATQNTNIWVSFSNILDGLRDEKEQLQEERKHQIIQRIFSRGWLQTCYKFCSQYDTPRCEIS